MKMLARLLILILTIALGAAAPPAQAAERLKLATVAPPGSVWELALQRLAADARGRSGGRVEIVLYPGGRQGDESTMIRKMRIGQLQAAALTQLGLTEIEPAFQVFAIPFFFASYEEMRFVLDRLTPALAQRLSAKGYHLLHWGEGGWVHLFSAAPIRTVEELKSRRLFVSTGDPSTARWLQKHGFTVVPLALNDVAVSLQTGMIQAMPSTPVAALSFQWYRASPHMLDIPLGPLVGATVVSSRAWKGLSDADRAALTEAGKEAQRRLADEVPKRDQEALAEMRKRGLSVTAVDPPTAAAWRATGDQLGAAARGELVPADIHDLAVRAREEYRRSAGGGKP